MAPKEKKKEYLTKGIYLTLAISVFALITFGIIGVFGNVFKTTKSKEATNPTSLANSNSLVTPVVVEDNGEAEQIIATETTPTTTAETKESTPPTTAVNTIKAYVRPAAGKVINDYSGEVLVYSKTMEDYRTHTGIDFAGEIGDQVLAFSDGTIKKVYEDPLMGNTVIIDHGNGLSTYYQCLSPNYHDDIKEGAAVKAGDIIGSIGESAMIESEEAPHLHFEVHKNDTIVSASDYISY